MADKRTHMKYVHGKRLPPGWRRVPMWKWQVFRRVRGGEAFVDLPRDGDHRYRWGVYSNLSRLGEVRCGETWTLWEAIRDVDQEIDAALG